LNKTKFRFSQANSKMWKKRCLLLFMVLVSTILFLFFKTAVPYVLRIVVVVCLISAFVINFPNVAPSIHNRPIWLSDLATDTTASVNLDAFANEIRARFFNYFFILVNVSFVTLLSVFTIYASALFSSRFENTNIIEIAGVIGGVLSLWSRAQQLAGRILLYLCYSMRKRKLEQHLVSVTSATLQSMVMPFQLERHREMDESYTSSRDFLGV
jgi:hypothetical protein